MKKQEYKNAMYNHSFVDMQRILIDNLLENVNHKTLNDMGIFLCDVDDTGITLNLSEEGAFTLGESLIARSFFGYPDVTNAFALQLVCLEKRSDYKVVKMMLEPALTLKNSLIINNIAYANYMLSDLKEALRLQELSHNLDKDKHVIINYNLMLYKLFNESHIDETCDHSAFLDVLISEDIFDYESALLLAVLYNDYGFVDKNINYYEKIFVSEKEVKSIIENYYKCNIIPSIDEVKRFLSPQVVIEKNFYMC